MQRTGGLARKGSTGILTPETNPINLAVGYLFLLGGPNGRNMTCRAIDGLEVCPVVTDQRVYPERMNIAACVRELEEHFSSQGYETQVLGTAPNVLVQVKKRGLLRTAAGLTTAMTAQFRKSQEGIVVTLGAHKWLDKATAGAVGVIIFAPLLLTAAYGAWKQSRLPDKFWEIINRYGMACPRCGSPNQGSPFCSNCGIALV